MAPVVSELTGKTYKIWAIRVRTILEDGDTTQELNMQHKTRKYDYVKHYTATYMLDNDVSEPKGEITVQSTEAEKTQVKGESLQYHEAYKRLRKTIFLKTSYVTSCKTTWRSTHVPENSGTESNPT